MEFKSSRNPDLQQVLENISAPSWFSAHVTTFAEKILPRIIESAETVSSVPVKTATWIARSFVTFLCGMRKHITSSSQRRAMDPLLIFSAAQLCSFLSVASPADAKKVDAKLRGLMGQVGESAASADESAAVWTPTCELPPATDFLWHFQWDPEREAWRQLLVDKDADHGWNTVRVAMEDSITAGAICVLTSSSLCAVHAMCLPGEGLRRIAALQAEDPYNADRYVGTPALLLADAQSGKSAVLRHVAFQYVPVFAAIPSYYATFGHVSLAKFGCTPALAQNLADSVERMFTRHGQAYMPSRGQQVLFMIDDLHLARHRRGVARFVRARVRHVVRSGNLLVERAVPGLGRQGHRPAALARR